MIRQLRPGEKLPEGEPRRYGSSQGYIRLRWRVGPRQYVETREHRVEGDHVTTAPHVHHRNHHRDDNRPENLLPITSSEHRRYHQKFDRLIAATLYLGGYTTIQVGALLGVDPATISRVLRAEGVKMRASTLPVAVPEGRLRELHAEGYRVPAIAKALGVGEGSVRRAMRDLELPSFPAGRPSA